jgi:hypothetical protein
MSAMMMVGIFGYLTKPMNGSRAARSAGGIAQESGKFIVVVPAACAQQ